MATTPEPDDWDPHRWVSVRFCRGSAAHRDPCPEPGRHSANTHVQAYCWCGTSWTWLPTDGDTDARAGLRLHDETERARHTVARVTGRARRPGAAASVAGR